jgi:hypothetical protein
MSYRNVNWYLFHNVHLQLLDSSNSLTDGLNSLDLSFSNILLVAIHDPFYSNESILDSLGSITLPFIL